jgi:outer membrane receptor for monomeric catechols
MNQIAQNTVDETVPVSTLEANTTETKTKSKETLDARNKRFLAFSVWIAQKLSAPLSDTSDSVNILSPETLNL